VTTALLAPFVVGHRPDDQAPTLALLDRLEDAGWSVERIALDPADPLAYAKELKIRWHDRHDWLIVEHDVVPSLRLLRELALCPDLLCTQPYPGAGFPTVTPPGGRPKVVSSSLGCVKISARARQVCGSWPISLVPWHVLDTYVTGALAAAVPEGWHVHEREAELVHNHARGKV
jgi:hypothetical protein